MEFYQKCRPKFNYGLSLKSFDFLLIREGSQKIFKYTFAYIKEDLGKIRYTLHKIFLLLEYLLIQM